jgi:hypothetical protein
MFEVNYPNVNHNSLMVRKCDGKLEFIGGQNYETRNQSTAKLIATADYVHSFNDFDWVLINTDDIDSDGIGINMPVYNYCTSTDDYSRVIPDFVFDSWPQTQLDDYDIKCKQISEFGNHPSETDLLGWRGAVTNANRSKLLSFTDNKSFDIQSVAWNRSNPDRLTSNNFVSFEDGVRKWRYLIDVEGRGWSARLKLYLFSKRVLFIQDRPFKEWFFPQLISYDHYVPVKRDLSDLEEKLDMIRSNPDLEAYIINSSYEFAKNNLTRKHAIDRMANVFKTLGE